MKLLLLEDDSETAAALERGLTLEGHEVAVANDVGGALALIGNGLFEAAVLDVMVPGGSGYDVLERLRNRPDPIPVLMLTARGSVEDRVEGLDRGADDYLAKPFSFAELVARLRALGRRQRPEPTRLRAGHLELDLTRRTASVEDRRLELTQIEFGLLAALLRAGGDPMGRRELLQEVWGYAFDPGTNVVDVHVNRLRRKLEDVGLGSLIQTVRGRGYAAR